MTPLTTARRCAILCVGGDIMLLILYALLIPILAMIDIARHS